MYHLFAVETEYRGYRFRSRLEARWAAFFDACGVKWEYEPDGFELPEGQLYLPEFLLHGVTFNHDGYSRDNDLFVTVRSQISRADAEAIRTFAFPFGEDEHSLEVMNPVLLVGDIPAGACIGAVTDAVFDAAYGPAPQGVAPFNFETVDGDYFGAMPGVGKDGSFQLFGDHSFYLSDMDCLATERAYRAARQLQFAFRELKEATPCGN